MTIRKKEITVADVHDLFTFAEKNYGIGWNPANYLFFHNAIEYGKINVIGTDYDAADNVEYFGEHYDEYFDGPDTLKERSYKDIPEEYLESCDDVERAHIIILAFIQENNITGDLYLHP